MSFVIGSLQSDISSIGDSGQLYVYCPALNFAHKHLSPLICPYCYKAKQTYPPHFQLNCMRLYTERISPSFKCSIGHFNSNFLKASPFSVWMGIIPFWALQHCRLFVCPSMLHDRLNVNVVYFLFLQMAKQTGRVPVNVHLNIPPTWNRLKLLLDTWR